MLHRLVHSVLAERAKLRNRRQTRLNRMMSIGAGLHMSAGDTLVHALDMILSKMSSGKAVR